MNGARGFIPGALYALGDVLGPLRYLGSCACCRDQFMSTHERVAVTECGVVCAKCAPKYVIEGVAIRCGVDMRPIEAEVHAKNMAKRGGPKVNGKQMKPKDPARARLGGVMLFVLSYNQPTVTGGGRIVAGTTWYARSRPGDGGVDWEYTRDPREAGSFSEHWRRRWFALHGSRAAARELDGS